MKRTYLWICLFATLLIGVSFIYQPAYANALLLTFVYGVVALFIEENFENSHPVKKTLGVLAIVVYCVVLYLLLNRY